MRIEKRNLWISVFALFPVTFLGVLFDDYQNGDMSREPFAAAAVFCVFVVVMMILFSLGKTVFSEDGITEQYLWIKKHHPWNQVIQVGLVPMDTDPSVKQLAFTFAGGIPWTGQKTTKGWKMKNGSSCLCIRYSEELYALVLKCYGPLDF